MVGVGGGLDLEFAVNRAERGIDREWDLPAGGAQVTSYLERVAVESGRVGRERDLGVILDVEEVSRAQVLVALGQLGVEAGGIDGQLHRGCTERSSVP